MEEKEITHTHILHFHDSIGAAYTIQKSYA